VNCPLKNKCTHGIIVERRAKKIEFAVRHKELILAAEYERHKQCKKYGFSMKLPPMALIIVGLLKKELDYSCRTVEWDIFSSLVRLLTKTLKELS
jgi:hypothetical protein